ncbi:MAG: geranylgeranylglycerol-phosphate geranylgeranyltransferase [Winogradskyella sp.]|uniref:geranylgeranylglycerol-phosphate geranylgeranyltransferase n=1 Tax=Winogradskyella sp. TaxID=1883156 RepID=UPI0017AAB103|nr:geranylgeranylglycerol-phosphate geranylgeranyltransferase [Winogradskyella sp.]MBT8243857.1 geranylgeranylglycerol-phosphate geranylgeranyltransferase [Winogradskyella sp.]NNK22262.1 geranylgeranylglycerol-phosphate geranylgeranyltransferase [Winogradskyella sp.]
MNYILKLIRWKNLLLIVLTQALIKYALLEPLKEDYGFRTALSTMDFIILVLATVFIAAAGYIINDIEDVTADKINKPESVIVGRHISEKTATNLFIALNFIGVILGFLISRAIGKPSFFIIFVLASALLYIYSTYLKSITLVGNIIVAGLVSLSILLVGVFDLVPAVTRANQSSQLFFLDLIKDYAIFAFMLNLLREIIKDIEDIDGDYKMGIKSLPIVLGRQRATKLAFILSLIPLGVIIIYLSNNLYKQPIAMGYVLLLIIAPLIYTCIKLFSAELNRDYKMISNILKLVMLTGILSLLLFQFILLK